MNIKRQLDLEQVGGGGGVQDGKQSSENKARQSRVYEVLLLKL